MFQREGTGVSSFHWRKRLVPIVLLVCGLLTAATLRLFVWPASSEVKNADAVVILSGDRGDRLAGALDLMQSRVAPVLVHAGTPDSARARSLCAQPNEPFEVVCVLPNPDDTRAEAKSVAELAHQRNWHVIIVVTSNFHATRAGITFRRCVEGIVVHVVPTTPSLGRRFVLWQVPGEWLRVAYLTLVHREC